MILKKLVTTLICLILIAPSATHGQSEINEFYQPKIETKRQIPTALNMSLWLTAYTASIYVLSRLETNNYALGVFYFVPSLGPFYRWDPENQSDEFEIRGENYVFASLSAYNFLAVDPDTQSSDIVFRNNVYANISLWGSLWIYRKYFQDTKPFLFPVVTNNSLAIYLNKNF